MCTFTSCNTSRDLLVRLRKKNLGIYESLKWYKSFPISYGHMKLMFIAWKHLIPITNESGHRRIQMPRQRSHYVHNVLFVVDSLIWVLYSLKINLQKKDGSHAQLLMTAISKCKRRKSYLYNWNVISHAQ